MTIKDRVKVFIGSGEASLIERKTLIYSLRKHTPENLDIYVLNGTHNAIELNRAEPFLAPMSLRVKYRNVTEFSLYRFLIPALCHYQGRAIYVDSDTIALTDISELFCTEMNGLDFLAKAEAYANKNLWALSVMLIDCERCRFDLEATLTEIDQDLYSMADFVGMSQRFLAHHPYQIGRLDPVWNEFDRWDQRTKLIHYTNLHTQPWKYQDHPYGKLWFEYFQEACAAGYVTPHDIQLSIDRSYVRPDLQMGNFSTFGRPVQAVKQTAKAMKAPLQTFVKERLPL